MNSRRIDDPQRTWIPSTARLDMARYSFKGPEQLAAEAEATSRMEGALQVAKKLNLVKET